MYNPISTYRIQFNKNFTFKQFIENIDYFKLLGIGTIYASPVFEAAPGSMHGYDIANPLIFNPEIGDSRLFDEISKKLKELKIGWLQDIVPNHMAFHFKNEWLMDVPEFGKSSSYAPYFDIDFHHPDFKGKIILPFLGKSAEEALEQGEIKLDYINNKPVFAYFDSHFPVNEESLISLFSNDINPHLRQIAGKLRNHGEELNGEVILAVNSDITRLKELLENQNYKLTFWQEIDEHLNYRRFFTISSLICMQMDNEAVFSHYHSFIRKLLEDGKIDGLRVDHIDGLRQPGAYIGRLRFMAGDDTYIVAEKILDKNEDLPEHWQLQGTTGYDFLAIVNNLLTYKINYPELLSYYNQLLGTEIIPSEILYQKKKLILSGSMQGDLDNLTRLFTTSGFMPSGNDPEITEQTVKESIGEFLLACPGYRIYADFFPLHGEEAKIVGLMIDSAAIRMPSLAKPLELLRNIFLDQESSEKVKRHRAFDFFLRCMQFTGPLMAKGQEDTAMYDYNCFIAHNEVGDKIDAQGITRAGFHELMLQRRRRFPLTMNSTSTHDTKRGEDVRARLAVLSEMPQIWIKNVNHWIILNRALKSQVNGKDAPDLNEEYFIYQTLTGVFTSIEDENFQERINSYIIKALREAKVHSNWNTPDDDYEKAVIDFIDKILAKDSIFMNSFLPFHKRVALNGMFNSLAQVTLKATCPGVPDFYQGCELPDLSLVDPDNRRSIDFLLLHKKLKNMIREEEKGPEAFLDDLYSAMEDGRLKMWLTHLLLLERQSDPELFLNGKYIPLQVTGRYRENIIAYARNYNSHWCIVVVPLYMCLLQETTQLHDINWMDTIIELPELSPDRWESIISKEKTDSDGFIQVSEILKLPIPCVLTGHTAENRRKAGLLMHITSLPGPYFCGDLGEEAYRFVDFLSEAGQTYWQILPVNPVDGASGWSPYSTYSAFAGNLLLIDPLWLLKNELISQKDLPEDSLPVSDQSDFGEAENFRMKILEKAYSTFRNHPELSLKSKFEAFCRKEDYWLDDYAIYLVLKKEFKNKPWYEWPLRLRNRDTAELRRYKNKFSNESERIKFNQFIFATQWDSLKKYANTRNVRIIGDMSFYVSYDSVDVWQHPEVFKLNSDKNMTGVGGVPPDYFSETGQLWNMPVYNWEFMKKDGYSWWRERIKRNIEWFDLVRFDHFRGFSGFWEVPAEEVNAVNGKWMDGPGDNFFIELKKNFPDMPFIAEDLGDIDDKVYELRDKFMLPGMRVLQFAFNEAMERSIHLPHNYTANSIVYTGTHDNNTTRGWYEQELSTKFRINADEYTNRKLNGTTVAEEFIRLAYRSVAFIAIIPIQDILGLGQNDRLNDPSGNPENWKWKLRSLEKVFDKSKVLQKLVKLYWRI